jgi:hypothetical protein
MDLHKAVATSLAVSSVAVFYYRKNAIGSYPRYAPEDVQSFPGTIPIFGNISLLFNLKQ